MTARELIKGLVEHCVNLDDDVFVQYDMKEFDIDGLFEHHPYCGHYELGIKLEERK